MTDVLGLHGYSLPLSPTGASSMVPPPPWHFSGDVVWVDFRVDPAAAAAFLPDGLDPGPDAGAAALGFFEWQWCSDGGAELRDPVRAQFNECVLVLACEVAGRPAARVPYAWVDDPVPLVRGLFQGLPKQPGAVRLTREARAGRAGPRRAPGGVFAASVAARDRRIAEAAVTLREPAAGPPVLNTVAPVHVRHLPAWDPESGPVVELVSAATTGDEYSQVWTGDAELRFVDVTDPDLATLAPVEVGAGYVFSYGETLAPGRRVVPHDGTPHDGTSAPK